MHKSLATGLFLFFLTTHSFAFKDTLDISFKSEGLKLRGKVIVPKKRSEKMPAVIFLVGSGGNSSSSTNYKKFTQFFFEQPLKSENVAIMYFDKRGVGGSQGVWFKTDFLDRALDVKNAAEYLKSLPFINENKIYIIGHSQGGWIVQLCLAQFPNVFAGGVSMAGATFGVRKQLVNNYQGKIICAQKFTPQKANIKAKRKANRTFAFVSIFPFTQQWKQLRTIRNFEIEPYLIIIKQPILYMWGETDELVYPGWCLDELSKKSPMGLPQNMETYISSGENHSFKKLASCYKGSTSEIPYSEESRDRLIKWLKNEWSKK